MKLRLQPIRVFCLHHVCAFFDAEVMIDGDWMQIDEFKSKVKAMQQDGVEFISLTEAYNHLKNDKIRNSKYAVISFDDGYASLKEILPWLDEQHIPATLFINGKYLDGKSYRRNPREKYLTKAELFALTSPLIEIGSHGWEHIRAVNQTEKEFKNNVEQCRELLKKHPRYIPFFAYTWGRHNESTDKVLKEMNIVPVLIQGTKNYSNKKYIDREFIC